MVEFGGGGEGRGRKFSVHRFSCGSLDPVRKGVGELGQKNFAVVLV